VYFNSLLEMSPAPCSDRFSRTFSMLRLLRLFAR
jgi:hypothetical protein